MQGGGLKIGFVETQNFAFLPPTTRDGGFGARSGKMLGLSAEDGLLIVKINVSETKTSRRMSGSIIRNVARRTLPHGYTCK